MAGDLTSNLPHAKRTPNHYIIRPWYISIAKYATVLSEKLHIVKLYCPQELRTNVKLIGNILCRLNNTNIDTRVSRNFFCCILDHLQNFLYFVETPTKRSLQKTGHSMHMFHIYSEHRQLDTKTGKEVLMLES